MFLLNGKLVEVVRLQRTFESYPFLTPFMIIDVQEIDSNDSLQMSVYPTSPYWNYFFL